MPAIFPALKKTLWQMLGPSIIFVALSLNGGEMLLWPNLAANYGLRILWPIPIILLLQFFVNIEIERYTLVTGKSVEASLVGNKKWLSIVFALTVLLALVWPAWVTTAGNLLSVVLGFQGDMARNVGLGSALIFLLGSVFIFRKKETYSVMEIIAKYGLGLTLGIIAVVVILKFNALVFISGLKGLLSFGYVPATMPRFDFVAALAYGGVAGVLNLVQSEWVKDKGYGVSALTQAEISQINFDDRASQKNYRHWFRMINREHFYLFVLANVCTIFLLAYLGNLLLPQGTAQGFGVLAAEIKALNSFIPYLGTLFGISGVITFIMGNITILDAIGRLVHRMLAPYRGTDRISRGILNWNAAKISQLAIYAGMTILVSSLFFPALKQPFFLLVLSASLSAFTMWLYPPLLLKLNLSLPKISRPSWFRSLMVLVAALFYGVVTLWALSAYVPLWIVVLVGSVVTIYHLFVLIPLLGKK